MSSVEQQYTNEIRNGLGYLGTWLPGTQIYLGDVGLIDNGVFKHVSHLEPLGVPFQTTRPDESTDQIEYKSSGKVVVEVTAEGESAAGFRHIGDAEAGIAVSFSDEKAVVLSAEGVRSDRIADLNALENSIRRLVHSWNRDWVIVTEVVTADNATILISDARDSRIELKATADVGPSGLKLAHGDAELRVAYSRGLHTQIVSATGLTPMFRAIRVRFGVNFWTGQPREGFELRP